MRRARAARAIVAGMLVCLAWLVLPAGARAASGPRTAALGGGPSAAAATAAGHPADAPAASGPAPATQSSPAAPAAGAVVLWGEPGLSAAQTQQLQRIARAARRWRAALPGLAAAARQQNDAALLDELAKLDALLQQVAATQRLTLAAYLAAMSASDQALSLWAADAAALAPGEQQAGQQADSGAADLADLTTAADTGFVFSADLSAGTALTYAEGPPPGDAGAVAGDAGAAPGNAGAAPGDAGAASGDSGPGGPGAADGGPNDAGGGYLPDDPGSRFRGDTAGPAAPAPVAGIDASGRPEAEGAGLAGVSEGDGALATALQSAGAALGMLQGGSREDGLASQALEPSDGSAGARGAGGAGAGWVIIHGGPDRSWQRESTVSKMGAAMPAPEAGDPRDGDLAPAGSAALRDGDSAAWAPAVFDWEEICRPWQPDTGTASVCPISALPLPAAGDP